MGSLNIMVKPAALIRRDNKLLLREKKLMEEQKAHLEAKVEYLETQVPETPKDLDLCALKEKRAFLEQKIADELRLNRRLHSDSLEKRAIKECKMTLLCLLRDFQKTKVAMAEAELATVVQQIWCCITADSESCLETICEHLDVELQNCPDEIDPFLADAIKCVLKDY